MPVTVTDWKGCLNHFYLSPMAFGYAPPFLGFFFWLFSPALSSSHSPFKRWNASTDRSVIMMFPFSMLDSSTSKTATTCKNRYLHMWWGGRDEKDVGKKAMGSWYWRMDLCTYYLDTIYIYIHMQAKRAQRPQPGKRRHTNSVFQTTSLIFWFFEKKVRPKKYLI